MTRAEGGDFYLATSGDLIWPSVGTLPRPWTEGLPLDLSAWETALCGDDHVLPAVWEQFEQVFRRPLAQGYGLTECLLVAVGMSPHDAREGMVVRPLPEVQIEVRGTDGAIVATGEVGEIWVNAPWRMKGRADDQSRPLDAVPTGDDGRLDEEGNLHIIGRRLSGLNLTEGFSPAWPSGPIAVEIEDLLIRDPRIDRVHVLWRGADALAFVEPRQDATVLPESMTVLGVVVQLVSVDRLPRTPVGKVSRRELPR